MHSELQAEDFLLRQPVDTTIDQAPSGALYIQPPTEQEDSLRLGIYLHPKVQTALDSFPRWPSRWSHPQLSAFGTAAEEVSHFHYVAHNAPQGRGVSQLELELQGEVDKFLITFFAHTETAIDTYAQLIESFFQDFRWDAQLTAEQKERYKKASQLAQAFLLKNAELFQALTHEKLLQRMREFYRLSLEGKISLATR